MARFLSAEWFAEVAAASPAPSAPPSPAPSAAGGGPGGGGRVVLEQVVEGGPDGRVVYRVVASDGQARISWPVDDAEPPADLRIRTDWDTAVAVARGEISTHRALLDGLLKVSGDPARFGGTASALAGADPVPAQVRAATTFSAG